MRDGINRDSLRAPAVSSFGTPLKGWPSLLLVDDDPQMLQALACLFERRGFHVAAAATVAEAKLLFPRHKTWMLVIADYHLPDGNGWEFCCWLRDQTASPPPCLLMSGHVHAEALCAGAAFLPKPFTVAELESRVEALLRPDPS
jgi:DNA-binding response OmpR family regulator